MKHIIIAAILVCAAVRSVSAQTSVVPLLPRDAGITGGAIYHADGEFIGSWNDPKAKLQWDLTVDEAGKAGVELVYSCVPSCGGKFALDFDGQKLTGTTSSTGSWDHYQTIAVGNVELAQGRHVVTLSAGPFTGAPMNVREIRLTPLKGSVTRRHPPTLPATFVVPNFHPGSCGWLTNWSIERNYCANSYLNHLDRVRDDANYTFALSECNNMIAIRNFAPQRFEEVKQRIKEGRVELVNAFFLEPTVSLSGGEALAKMGIEGLRWQEQVMGSRPRFCWAIDICGTPDQMPQLCRQLGLDALVYTRENRSGKTAFWSESPDGSRILTLVPGLYCDFQTVMRAKTKLTINDLFAVERQIAGKARYTPTGAPVLFLAGGDDYSLAPPRREVPTEFLDQWKIFQPKSPVKFSTLSQYVDAFQPAKLDLPVVRAGTSYSFDSFWIQSPRVKSWYRRDEHALQAAETLATIASLKAGFDYPVQPFYHSWLQMLLNMDRATLWGNAAGVVFEHETSWDVKDRFEWVEKQTASASADALRKLTGTGGQTVLFNPLNWQRGDFPELPACGIGPATDPATAKEIALPATIETPFYSARIDPATGALASLKTKPSGHEMLSGPANVLVLEQHTGGGNGNAGDFTYPRPQRPPLDSSSKHKPVITVTESAQAITVEARSDFHEARCITRFNKTHPRIEFTSEVTDLPNLTVLVSEFPLAETPKEIRRGIPFGFSRDDNYVGGILPAVRWSDYSTPGKGGIALLDRGLTGREINGKTPIIYLCNATDTYHGYASSWLSGKGAQRFDYALVAHDTDWAAARVPQQAWEFNCPPVAVPGCATAKPESFLKTSDNVIVEVMRRDGKDIELRVVECLGVAGNAEITVSLPHKTAALTDMVGGHAVPLPAGPTYRFPVRPQQIVTLRLRTASPVPASKPLTEWDELVPANKLPALHRYFKDKVGHPPFNDGDKIFIY